MNTRWLVLGVVAVGLASRPGSLRAQTATEHVEVGGDDRPWNRGVPPEVRQAARDLFLEGNRLFHIPLFAQAAEKYTAALGKWKHPAFYFNLALAQLNLGQDVEAHDNLQQAAAVGEGTLDPVRFQEARQQLQSVEGRLGRIEVHCSTPGAEVTLDGASLFTGPGNYQGWAKAQAHEITARKPDYLSEARRVMVARGELASLELRLITLSEAADRGRRWVTWKPWAVVAAGVVVAAGGGVLHALSSRDFNTYDTQFSNLDCVTMSPPHGCKAAEIPTELSDRLARARREQQIAIAGYAVGGGLVAVGAALLYLNRPRIVEQATTSSPIGRVAVTPSVSADRLGVVVTVSH